MAGSQTFTSAYRAIARGELAPVLYLTGPEDVLKDELITLIKDRVLDPTTRDFNCDVRSASDLDGESLHALVETPPMLAERRLVVVRNLEHWRRNAKVWQVLERYLANPSPTTILVLTHGGGEKTSPKVAKQATTVEMRTPTPQQMRRWVEHRAEASGIKLESAAADHLLRAVGADLSQLAVEIDKLSAAAPEDRPVSANDVAALVGMRRGETPHDLVAAVLAGETERAVGMLDVVLSGAGVNGVRLVTLLGTTLVGVRIAKAMTGRPRSRTRPERAVFDAIRAARPPGLRGWREEAADWAAAASRWSDTALDEAIRTVYDADRLLKSSTVSDQRGILTDMTFRLGHLRAAA